MNKNITLILDTILSKNIFSVCHFRLCWMVATRDPGCNRTRDVAVVWRANWPFSYQLSFLLLFYGFDNDMIILQTMDSSKAKTHHNLYSEVIILWRVY